VALGGNGEALVNAATFDDGSYDNCAPVHLQSPPHERQRLPGPRGISYDQVKFCCSDINDTITVVFRVYDVPVQTAPSAWMTTKGTTTTAWCRCLWKTRSNRSAIHRHVPVTCENFDPSLWAYGFATATDNCCIDTITDTTKLLAVRHGVQPRHDHAHVPRLRLRRPIEPVHAARGGELRTGLLREVPERRDRHGLRRHGQLRRTDLLRRRLRTVGRIVRRRNLHGGAGCLLQNRTHLDDHQLVYVQPEPAGCIEVPNPNPNATTNHPANLPGPTVSPAARRRRGTRRW
jgi:hypothetical protein